jgi:hypothetical protein
MAHLSRPDLSKAGQRNQEPPQGVAASNAGFGKGRKADPEVANGIMCLRRLSSGKVACRRFRKAALAAALTIIARDGLDRLTLDASARKQAQGAAGLAVRSPGETSGEPRIA